MDQVGEPTYPMGQPFHAVGDTGATTATLRDDGAKEVSFAANACTAVEGGAGVEVTVRLNQASDVALEIPLKAQAGSGTDFTGAPSSVSFAPGADEATFMVTATGDLNADDETLTICIDDTTAPLLSPYAAGTPGETVITLVDGTVTFTVLRSGGTDTAITVSLDVTVSADAPGTSPSGTSIPVLPVEFAANQTTMDVTVDFEAALATPGARDGCLTATVVTPVTPGAGYEPGTTPIVTARIETQMPVPALFTVSIAAADTGIITEGDDAVFTVTRALVPPNMLLPALAVEVDISGDGAPVPGMMTVTIPGGDLRAMPESW